MSKLIVEIEVELREEDVDGVEVEIRPIIKRIEAALANEWNISAYEVIIREKK